MRKTWLAVIPFLLSCGPLAAQSHPGSGWAVDHPPAAPMTYVLVTAPPAAIQPPQGINANGLGAIANAGGNAPITVLAVPVAVQPVQPAQPGCAGGNCAARAPLDWQHFSDWLCYHSIKGGCPKKGSCGCNCSVPLYVYFLKECKEGRKFELPPCVQNQEKPGILRNMVGDGRSLLRSAGTVATSCPGGGCAAGQAGH